MTPELEAVLKKGNTTLYKLVEDNTDLYHLVDYFIISKLKDVCNRPWE